jgi:hypothetical protein
MPLSDAITDANTLDVLIVKHIGDLEAAQRRIVEEIDPRLRKEASAMMKKRADELGWVHELFDGDDPKICVAPEEWIKRSQGGKVGTWLVYFQLSSLDADGELTPHSQLAEFLDLEGGSRRKALSIFSDVLKPKEWRAVLTDSASAVQSLRDLGFDVDERRGSISLPVRLNSPALQQGFQVDDLNDALAPIGAALDLAVQARPHLQSLASAALASSKD